MTRPDLHQLRILEELATAEAIRKAEKDITISSAERVLERMEQVPKEIQEAIIDRINNLNI